MDVVARLNMGSDESFSPCNEVLPVRRGGEFVVATDSVHALHCLPSVLQELGRRYPSFSVSIEVADVDSAVQKLVHQEVDLVVQTGSHRLPPSVTTASLHHWNYVGVVPSYWDVKAPLSLTDLQAHPLVTLSSCVEFRDVREVPFHLDIKAHDMHLVKSLVKMGGGVGIVPSFACDEDVDDEVQLIELDPLLASSQTCLLVRRATYPGALIIQLMKALAKRFETRTCVM